MERRQDILLGGIFAALGLYAAWIASGYRGATGTYPMVLGAVMAGFGLLVAAKAALRGRDAPRPLTANTGRALIAVATGAVYLALVPLLGFYTASALLMLGLPAALGFHRPVYLALVAAVFVGIVWTVFSVVLEKPLPAEIWRGF